MGYIGAVTIFGEAVRAMSSTLKATQRIDHPDVVDNRIDWTLYQLGPIEVEGDVVVPVVKSGESQTFLNNIWDWAVKRDLNSGELLNNGQVVLNYSYDIGRTFNGCRVNRLALRATAGERVEATLGFLGTTFQDGASIQDPIDFSPARVLMWDDVTIGASAGFETCEIREFSIDIANNLSRNYTFCPDTGLFASNISTGKRNVTGTLQFQGFAQSESLAETNSARTTSDETLTFDFDGFTKTLNHIIYELQDIAINTGIITSTANWYAHAGADDFAVEDQ
jgi:hypothetical protein